MKNINGTMEISWVDIDSSTIESISIYHSDKQRSMLVEFRNGSAYMYGDIDIDTIGKLITSESVGKAFSALIKNKFPYKRV